MASNQQDPIGSLEWAFNNSGALLSKERKSLLTSILKTAVELIGNGIRYEIRHKLGLHSKGTGKIELTSLKFPDSQIAQDAEEECLSTLSDEVISHSLRTFVFGLALSQVEELYKKVDVEHFYVTSLLHDIAIESQNSQTGFAVAGGQKTLSIAHRSGKTEALSQNLGDAVSMHITPGINKACPGSLAALLSDASLLDLSGYKIWNLDRNFVQDVDGKNWVKMIKNNSFDEASDRSHSRTTKHSRLYIAECWKRRALAFPDGRVALVENFPPGLSHIIRHTPLR